jgi:hypothetical protein
MRAATHNGLWSWKLLSVGIAVSHNHNFSVGMRATTQKQSVELEAFAAVNRNNVYNFSNHPEPSVVLIASTSIISVFLACEQPLRKVCRTGPGSCCFCCSQQRLQFKCGHASNHPERFVKLENVTVVVRNNVYNFSVCIRICTQRSVELDAVAVGIDFLYIYNFQCGHVSNHPQRSVELETVEC